MTELIAFACLIANPTACKDVSLNISDNLTPMQCLMYSQQEAAKWIEANPGWRVAKLTCGRVGRYARI